MNGSSKNYFVVVVVVVEVGKKMCIMECMCFQDSLLKESEPKQFKNIAYPRNILL
jgi:hypothetical protein